eukprot:313826-Amphidinium_carterae.1
MKLPLESRLHHSHKLVDMALLLRQQSCNAIDEVWHCFGWMVAAQTGLATCRLQYHYMPGAELRKLRMTVSMTTSLLENAFIFENAWLHILMPSVVEMGHTDLSHKVSACVFFHALECKSRSDLSKVLANYHLLTRDMGREFWIATYLACADVIPLLWHPDVTIQDGDDEEADYRLDSNLLLPNSA